MSSSLSELSSSALTAVDYSPSFCSSGATTALNLFWFWLGVFSSSSSEEDDDPLLDPELELEFLRITICWRGC